MPVITTYPAYLIHALLEKGANLHNTVLLPKNAEFWSNSLESRLWLENLNTLIADSECFPTNELNKFANFTELLLHGMIIAKEQHEERTLFTHVRQHYEEDDAGHYKQSNFENAKIRVAVGALVKGVFPVATSEGYLYLKIRIDAMQKKQEEKAPAMDPGIEPESGVIKTVSAIGPFFEKLRNLEQVWRKRHKLENVEACKLLGARVARKITRAVICHMQEDRDDHSKVHGMNLNDDGDVTESGVDLVNFNIADTGAAIAKAEGISIRSAARHFVWPLANGGERR